MDYSKFKAAVFDFDDTLCIHTRHSYNEDDIQKEKESVLAGENPWPDGVASKHMSCLLMHLKQSDIPMFLMSSIGSSPIFKELEASKIVWVDQHYGYQLEPRCCNLWEDKVLVLEQISQEYDILPEEILLVDDFWPVVHAACAKGFKAYSPMEIVEDLETT